MLDLLKTKDNAVHVGHSPLLVHLKDFLKLRVVCNLLVNNNLSIVLVEANGKIKDAMGVLWPML
jgi:hypothetical protein